LEAKQRKIELKKSFSVTRKHFQKDLVYLKEYEMDFLALV